ncbi:hypothetical protein [Microbacterium sp. PMB16]|uniref:hypothetical protein n=1 Tax=Microbacterium sp. PMB16 TaxID=3120157 RepID=UPI003F4BEE60
MSHSSAALRVDNIRGSFNGWDIRRSSGGLENSRDNFDALFALHQASRWEETVERLVDASAAITGRESKLRLTPQQTGVILDAPRRARAALTDPWFIRTAADLEARVQRAAPAILQAAYDDNSNLRGQQIEQIITGDPGAHRLDDLESRLSDGRLSIDIKSKRLDRSSAPKAYNVDKMLAFLAQSGSVAAVFAVGIDTRRDSVVSSLVPVLDEGLVRVTGVQHHWAGRESRGVAQFGYEWSDVLRDDYVASIDIDGATEFLRDLIVL